MKRLLAAIAAILLAVATPATAEVVSKPVCQNKLMAPSNADTYGLGNGIADCTYTDISGFSTFSYQVNCVSASTVITVDVDWVAGSAASPAYMGVPILASGSALAQLQTAWATESTWSVLEDITTPAAPVGTIRITNNATTADVYCDAILNMRD